MKFQLQVTMTEDDYLEFNKFQLMRSSYGAKNIRTARIIVTSALLIAILLVFLIIGVHTFSILYAVFILICILLYNIFHKRWMIKQIKADLKRLKKSGKPAYDPFSHITFEEDSLIDTTDCTKTEVKYSAIEKISIIKGKYIFLHTSNIGAVVLPANSFDNLDHYNNFIEFLETLNIKTDVYENI